LEEVAKILAYLQGVNQAAGRNYGMKEHPTNPIKYCKDNKIGAIWRFILTHPDMDHMDGLSNLFSDVTVGNFWETGVRKAKPDFTKGKYNEADWDCYANLIAKKRQGVTILSNLAGAKFQFANEGDPEGHGDCLSIVAPDPGLVKAANEVEDTNDASYVIVYRSAGGRIVFPGDAHDGTWEYVLKHHRSLVENCAVLIAPHHGRHSDRSFEFLDVLNPKLTLFGCAPSEHLAYDAWNNRQLLHITNNQAGNVVLKTTEAGIEVYVENEKFAESYNSVDVSRTHYGCYFIGIVPKPTAQAAAA
jgi:beta-lactamase superfamily II metal-dependent hydrolase